MTSGEFHRIPVDKIWLVRDERQRRELKEEDIKILADSISRLGLIHPIVIDRDHKLCAGERRLAAIKMLAYDYVVCQFTDEVDPLRKRAIELEENVKRVDLTWQEQYSAVTEYNSIGKQMYPDSWTQEKAGEGLGLGRSMVTQYLGIEKEVKRGNSDILKQDQFSGARRIMLVNEEKRLAAQFERERAVLAEHIVHEEKSIIQADFCEWAASYTGPRFNFLHCDFPYGIETTERNQGNAVAVHGSYDDSPDTYWRLLNALCSNLDRICAESAHIMFWFSMHYYADTLDFFTSHSDFTIDPFPLIWMKSDGKGLLPDPQRGPRRIYETCLFGSRGDRKIVASVANAYAAPTDSRGHLSAKPEPVLRHFFRMFVDENSTVLDPTCGGGSALRAAESLDASLVIGVERDGEFAERADLALRAARRLRKATA